MVQRGFFLANTKPLQDEKNNNRASKKRKRIYKIRKKEMGNCGKIYELKKKTQKNVIEKRK